MVVSTERPMVTKGRNKTHKVCPRCHELKPVSEFCRSVPMYDGLVGYCRKCSKEYMRKSCLMTNGKRYSGLHKRPFPLDGKCEICNIEFGKPGYHHWDDDNLSLGIFVCCSCDYLAEGLDEIERNIWKADTYHRLKEEVEKTEKTYVCLGSYSPPNGIHRLFLNGKQTHKWCPHCGKMKLVEEFYENYSRYDGLQVWCGECLRSLKIGSQGKEFYGLHKRPKSNCCELCGGKVFLHYHHWDDSNKSKGLWLCQTNKCHNLAEAVDLIDNDSLLPDKYSELKQRIILGEV